MMCDFRIVYSIPGKSLEWNCPHETLGCSKGKGIDLCIFHDESKKDEEIFCSAFEKLYKKGDHSFIGFVFPEGFSFSRRKGDKDKLIFKNACFDTSTFLCAADFMGAQFTGDSVTSFRSAEFRSEAGADFSFAEFSGEGGVSFNKAQFLGGSPTNFSFSQFSGKGPTDFTFTVFSGDGGTNFGNAQFKGGNVFFAGSRFLGKGPVNFYAETFIDNTIVFFIDAKFENAEEVTFDGVNLCNVFFLDTNLRKINFKKVYWRNQKYEKNLEWDYSEGNRLKLVWDSIKKYPMLGIKGIIHQIREELNEITSRIMLYDEIGQRGVKSKKYGADNHYKVQQLYDQLRLNYEETGRYYEAGDFFVGAMEMRRTGEREKWIIRKALFWYKWISLYGERPARALGLLLVLMVLFGGIYSFCDLKPIKDITESTIVSGFWRGLMISLSNLTLGRIDPLYAVSNPVWSNILKFFETIFGGIVVSLFLLAMNRKFRRVKD